MWSASGVIWRELCGWVRCVINVINSLENDLLHRITLNPDICPGKPTIRNRRYLVELILDLLSAGMTHQEILSNYPALEEDDIRACLACASRLTSVQSIHEVLT